MGLCLQLGTQKGFVPADFTHYQKCNHESIPLNAMAALLTRTSTPPYFSLKYAAAVVMLFLSLMSSW